MNWKLSTINLRLLTFVLVIGVIFAPRFVCAQAGGFLKAYCVDCHTAETKEGGLDLTALKFDLAQPALFAKWERIHDRIASGEMPPKSATQPPAMARKDFLEALAGRLVTAHQATKGTVLRRLNRREYQNTLNDLFGTNLKLADRLPEDSRADEFDNVGEALGISVVQMQRYLESITVVLDEATQRAIAPPTSKVITASYAKMRDAEKWIGKIWLERPDGAVVFFKPFGYPSGMLREANVQKDGWYKIRVTGYAYQSETPITFSVGASTFARALEQPTYGFFAFPPGKPTTIETTAWIPARYMVELNVYGITDRFALKDTPIAEYKGPGLAIQSIEVEGPIVEEFPTRGHQLVYDGLQREEILPKNREDRNKSFYVPKFEVTKGDLTADITPALLRVATKAFRRPVTAAQIQPYVQLYSQNLASGASPEEAVRSAVMAIFCSPDFIYFRERSGKLDDFELATRLSYFLTRSTPDEELLAAAAAGKLTRDKTAILAQAERLLKHSHSERFVADFTDAWLNLRDIEFTTPDGALYPEYDPFLQWSCVAETRSFFRKLLDENLSVTNIVKSDFAILNNRLAEHYGIPGVDGPELRSVPLPADSVRGGFLSQASVLKVTANGTNTSPVVRGVWVMERILGEDAPPPPPGVPGVEPDIRGASTLRELLDKHRSLDSCRGCHQAIDPPGFALESFDPIGTWRERFRSLGGGEKVAKEVRGQKVRYQLGPAVDASGQLLDGRKFAGYLQFRDLLAEQREVLAKTLASKLLTFATGRELGFSDRAELDRIVATAKQSNYGVHDLLKLVVTSEIFQNK